MSFTMTIAQHLVDMIGRPVPEHLLDRAAIHVLDWLACAVLGTTAPAGERLLRYGMHQCDGCCSTLGAGSRTAETAAFINGGLGNIFEMDDVHRTSIVHPGDTVIPAALALAQRENASGAAFLAAVVRGYEAAIRVGAAAGTGHYRYWYNTATCGVFGAAVAATSLMRAAPGEMVDAIGQAGMQAAGLWQCRLEPTFSKQLATARAAQSGVIAADLAVTGFPGPAEIFEGELGFFAATCPGADPADIVGIGSLDWRIEEVSFKPWSACRHATP